MIGVAFGWAILASLRWLFTGKAAGDVWTPDAFSDDVLYGIVFQELLLAPVAACILYVRGWRVKDFPIGASAAMTALGFGMAIATSLADSIISTIAGSLSPVAQAGREAWDAYRPSTPLGMTAVLTLSLVNPIFEEVFVCAYVIEALRKRFGETTAINVSVVIRSSYHLYQGIGALPFHFVYGLMQAYVYVRVGRLWPLIVSHALLDFLALASLL